MPRGLVLDPLLFVKYMNDLGEIIFNMVSMFVDDTNVGCVVDREKIFLD